MIQTLSYSEMNQLTVPGSNAFSPRFECQVPLECQVPSPSQWSDAVCQSPPSLHSPPYTLLEKLKEEPFSPSSQLISSTSAGQSMSVVDSFESSINLAEVLEESFALAKQVRHYQTQQFSQQQVRQSESRSPSFPLSPQAAFSVQNASQPASFKLKLETDDGLSGFDFLDSLVEVKKEFLEEEKSPENLACALTPLTTESLFCTNLLTDTVVIGDGLQTVEMMALDHCRQNVNEVSARLGISKESSAWSSRDVRVWLEYEAQQRLLPLPSIATWNMTGVELNNLSEAEFRAVVPQGGEILYARLDIWRRTSSECSPMSCVSPSYPTVASPTMQFHTPGISVSRSTPTQPLSVNVQSPSYLMEPGSAAPHLHHSPSFSCASPNRLLLTPSPPSLSPLSSPMQLPTPVLQKSVPSTCFDMVPPVSPHCLSPYATDKRLDVKSLLQGAKGTAGPTSVSPAAEAEPEGSDSDNEHKKEKATVRVSVGGRGGTHIHLWQFLKELLMNPQQHGSCIRWIDRSKGIFKIEDSVRVARLWGKRKNRPAMNYDKLSRSIRQYYRKGIMKKTERSQRLVYQFCTPYGL